MLGDQFDEGLILYRTPTHYEYPPAGGKYSVTFEDVIAALRMAPVWIHSGWIEVVWKYRRTRLGPFWYTLSLAIFVIVMGVIWGKVLQQNPVEYFRYVGTSLIAWSFISSMITDATGLMIAGESTVMSMRFPYVAFAFKHVWCSLLLFAHHLILYIIIMACTTKSPGWPIFMAIPGLLLVMLNGIWISTIIGMACLKKRDLVLMIISLMQIMMFVTPVFWPKDLLGPELAYAVDFNPLYHLLTVLRSPLLGIEPPVSSWVWGIGTLAIGSVFSSWIYGKYRDRLAYWF